MKGATVLFLFFYLFTIIACKTELAPIHYGSDQCASCKMIISDQRFGAELVTVKGKIFKYDAIECMLRTLAKESPDLYRHIGINYYDKPGQLFDGQQATYLVSKKIPSPMGGFLSAYGEQASALNQQQNNGGEIYSFPEILASFKKEYGQ